MNAEALSDEAFEAPLSDRAVVVEDPGAVPLLLSLVAMILVVVAFLVPVAGSLFPLYVAGSALKRLARLEPHERRRVPLHIRKRVRRRSMSAAGFGTLFAVLWLAYLL